MLYWKLSHCQVPKYDTMKNLHFLKLIAKPTQKIARGNVQRLKCYKANLKHVFILGNDPIYDLATKANRDQFEQQFHQNFIESFVRVGD